MGTALVGRRTVVHELLDHTTCSAVENRKRQRFPQRTSPFCSSKESIGGQVCSKQADALGSLWPEVGNAAAQPRLRLAKPILKPSKGAIIRVRTASRTRTGLCCPVDTNSLIAIVSDRRRDSTKIYSTELRVPSRVHRLTNVTWNPSFAGSQTQERGEPFSPEGCRSSNPR
jgi:hypothetical protein